MSPQLFQRLRWAPVVLILAGVAVAGASETASNVLVLLGGLGLIALNVTLWNDPGLYGVFGSPTRARVVAAIFTVLAVGVVVLSAVRLA